MDFYLQDKGTYARDELLTLHNSHFPKDMALNTTREREKEESSSLWRWTCLVGLIRTRSDGNIKDEEEIATHLEAHEASVRREREK